MEYTRYIHIYILVAGDGGGIISFTSFIRWFHRST